MGSQPVVMILGGGAGQGLYPLTKNRSKAAVPIAGKYRLIDIPISNCLASELYHIFLLTQYNSGSLNRHIVQTFQIPYFLDGFVEIRAASLSKANPNWYQGTADAVRQNLSVLRSAAELRDTEHVLILSGDHLYQMDYRPLIQHHIDNQADITLAVSPTSPLRTGTLGVTKVDEHLEILDFIEKPSPDTDLSTWSWSEAKDPATPFLGSMGLYVFRIDVLAQILSENPNFDQFGRDVLPYAAQHHRMFAYPFHGYWENIGTLRHFYEAMLALTGAEPPFDLSSTSRTRNRFFTRGRSLPSAKVNQAYIEDALLAEGSIVEVQTKVSRSVIGSRAFVGESCEIEDSVLFGCDFYESIEERQAHLAAGEVPLGIGRGSRIKGCIIDKNVRIGRDVVLENTVGCQHADTEFFSIRDGVVVVPKNVVIQDGFRLEEALN